MKIPMAVVLATALVTTMCATRRDLSLASDTPRLTSAIVTFTTLENGKDTGSAVTVQLLRGGNQLGAEVRSAGTEFDDKAISPLAMSMMGPFTAADAQEASLRLRFTPEGRDTWTFNVRLSLTFSDNTQQNFVWTGLRLDETSVERTLTLAGARV